MANDPSSATRPRGAPMATATAHRRSRQRVVERPRFLAANRLTTVSIGASPEANRGCFLVCVRMWFVKIVKGSRHRPSLAHLQLFLLFAPYKIPPKSAREVVQVDDLWPRGDSPN